MIQLYCKAHHQPDGRLCKSCEELSQYSRARLAHCAFKENKPTCGKCPIHCYKKKMRTEVKKIMRWAGPRMLFRHPILALEHLIQGRRTPPDIKNFRKSKK